MSALGLIASILNFALLLYIFVLFGRLILEYIPMFNREWRPKGAVLVLAEIAYTLTDPPIKMFRRVIPPLRVGGIAIDFAFALTMLLCFILLSVTRTLTYL
ncbi:MULTISPECIES: YggT family protein [Microbacterium]|uniref:YggT family protein n=1 Tax=Microbacterium barkeri TaxID=33917 RepID=A0A9W6H3E8_9MICO|nr:MULTISPECIES: YggT family protein [Microbacterium]MDI6943542.1 YggT family protein [Microbacterium barkeri]MDR6875603.1 YggT family protein [Microbacterium barkeri]WRH17832.1 YggT family protein [Microbacterium sp. JZ37]GLJ61548.1 YggT family protein [Microbacterium barkeri]